MGTVLELSFVNFEDWMVCDYRPKEGKGFIDRYIEANSPDNDQKDLLEAMRDSVLSLHEVVSVNDTEIALRDLLLEKDVTVPAAGLEELKPGEIFATRVIEHGGSSDLGRGIWPFGAQRKDQAMEFLNAHIERVRRNRDQKEPTESTLKQDAWVFNNIWISCLSLK